MKEKGFNEYFKLFKRDVLQYVELKLQYYKLEFVDVFSTIFSKLISVGVALLVGVIFLTFLLFALALFLGDILGAYYWGFLIVAGVFLLLGIIFILSKNKLLTNPLVNTLIGVLFEKEIRDENRRKKVKR